MRKKKIASLITITPRLLPLKIASVYMGRSVYSMRTLAWGGKIPVVKDGKKIYFDRVDLDRYIEQNKSTYL